MERYGANARSSVLAGIVLLLSATGCDPSRNSKRDPSASEIAEAVRSLCLERDLALGNATNERSLAQFVANTPDTRTMSEPLAWCVALAISKDAATTGVVYSITARDVEQRTEWVVATTSPRSAGEDLDRVLDEVGGEAGGLAKEGFALYEVVKPSVGGEQRAKTARRKRVARFVRSILVASDVGTMECLTLRSRAVPLSDAVWICFWIGLDPDRSETWRSLATIET